MFSCSVRIVYLRNLIFWEAAIHRIYCPKRLSDWFRPKDLFKQICDVLQSCRYLQALWFSYKLYFHMILYVKVMMLTILCRKRKNRYPYLTKISEYLSGSYHFVSDLNPKLHYSGTTWSIPDWYPRKQVFTLSIPGTRQVYLIRFNLYAASVISRLCIDSGFV